MNINYIINGVRRYGIKGIVNKIFKRSDDITLDLFLSNSCIRKPTFFPERGISIIGNFSYPGSTSKVLRDLAKRLKKCGIPYQTFNIQTSESTIPTSEFENYLTLNSQFCANKYSHVIEMFTRHGPYDKRCRNFRIGFWEFESGLVYAHPCLIGGGEVVAFSDFNIKIFRKLLPKSIRSHKILFPFQFDGTPPSDATSIRKDFKIDAEDFVVFFNFDYSSGYYRKNPEGLIKAFAIAFKDTPHTKLVFKTMRAKANPHLQTQLIDCARKYSISDKLICIDNFMPQDKLISLTATANVYASLHRGEGFGIGIAEAMSLGIPIVATNYSATTEFCKSSNSILIPYSMIKVPHKQIDNNVYRHVDKWAEPDINSAADALRRLYLDPELSKQLGENGQHFIKEYFSDENFKSSIDSFLSS